MGSNACDIHPVGYWTARLKEFNMKLNNLKMSKLYQCPYDKATTCNLQDPCLGCETFSEFLKAQVETPSVGNKKGKKKKCQTQLCEAPLDFLQNFEGCAGCPYYY